MQSVEFNSYYNNYTQYLSRKRILREAVDSLTVGFFLGSFKPPHVGHFNAVKAGMAQTDVMHVVVSPGYRGMTPEEQRIYFNLKNTRRRWAKQGKPTRGKDDEVKEMESKMISPMQSKLIWDEYGKALSRSDKKLNIHLVDVTEFRDPVSHTENLVKGYAMQPNAENTYIKLFIGKDDLAKGDVRNDPIKSVEGLGGVEEVAAIRSHSATDARAAIVDGDQDAFNKSQPDHPAINKDYIWDILYDSVTY